MALGAFFGEKYGGAVGVAENVADFWSGLRRGANYRRDIQTAKVFKSFLVSLLRPVFFLVKGELSFPIRPSAFGRPPHVAAFSIA
jgi:hypothetical protein